LGAPIPGVIGRELVEALVGTSPPLVDVLAAARAGDRVQPIVLRSTTLGRAIRVTAARIPAPGAGGAQDQSVVVLVEDVTAQQAPVDLNDVIQRTLLLMSYDLTLKDIAVEKDLGTVPPVLGDRHALQQVLLNLLNNAAQAVAENPPDRPGVIRIATWFDDRVRMRVADSGRGITDDALPHLFTPFFT